MLGPCWAYDPITGETVILINQDGTHHVENQKKFLENAKAMKWALPSHPEVIFGDLARDYPYIYQPPPSLWSRIKDHFTRKELSV